MEMYLITYGFSFFRSVLWGSCTMYIADTGKSL